MRESCIEDRTEKVNAAIERELIEAAEKEKIAKSEKEEAIAIENKKELDKFVREAKALLTSNYKDPSSAQFIDLVVVERYSPASKTLCGSVNAKNSYGGYIGFNKFFVVTSSEIPNGLAMWNEGQFLKRLGGDAKYERLRTIAMETDAEMLEEAKKICGKEPTNSVIMIE